MRFLHPLVSYFRSCLGGHVETFPNISRRCRVTADIGSPSSFNLPDLNAVIVLQMDNLGFDNKQSLVIRFWSAVIFFVIVSSFVKRHFFLWWIRDGCNKELLRVGDKRLSNGSVAYPVWNGEHWSFEHICKITQIGNSIQICVCLCECTYICIHTYNLVYICLYAYV